MSAPEELIPGVPLAYATEAEVIRMAARHAAFCPNCRREEPCGVADSWARAVVQVTASADRVTEQRVKGSQS